MYRTLGAVALTVMSLSPAHAQDIPDIPSLESSEAQAAYAIGQNMARSLTDGGFEGIDVEALVLGIRDRMSGTEPRLSEGEMRTAVTALQAALQAEQEAAQQAQFEEKFAANAAFLAENGAKDGITTTESGLQYRVDAEGAGTPPTAGQTVRVHYAGRLLDGTEFDSSYSRGAPAEFGVSQVIPGWTEALQLMAPGAKWEVWLPSDIAYGPRGAGGSIGPHEVLNFTIELIEVLE